MVNALFTTRASVGTETPRVAARRRQLIDYLVSVFTLCYA